MSTQIGTIKSKIKLHLDALKTASVLGSVIEDDFKTDPIGGLGKNVSAWPAAILGAPSIDSQYETNRDNLRTYNFEVLFILKGENISGVSVVEDLMETVLNEFDNDPTLGGVANGAVEPTASTPSPVTGPDGTFIVFTVTIKARALVTLTF